MNDEGKCATFSGQASFSSSLKGLFVVQVFRVAGWLRGGERTKRGYGDGGGADSLGLS